jgi:hypothetical protein
MSRQGRAWFLRLEAERRRDSQPSSLMSAQLGPSSARGGRGRSHRSNRSPSARTMDGSTSGRSGTIAFRATLTRAGGERRTWAEAWRNFSIPTQIRPCVSRFSRSRPRPRFSSGVVTRSRGHRMLPGKRSCARSPFLLAMSITSASTSLIVATAISESRRRAGRAFRQPTFV